MIDPDRYQQWMQVQAEEWEAKCNRCGACCGAMDDPCENLHRDDQGKYFCHVYEWRFAQWKTVSGQLMTCVPLREKLVLGQSWPGDEQCGYKRS